MSPRLGYAVVRGLGTATLMLLGFGCFTPRPAAATCGDYLMIGGHSGGAGVERAASRIQSGTKPPGDPGASESGDVPSRREPCRGPSCSSGSPPPAAPAPTVEAPLDHWLLGNCVCDSTAETGTPWSWGTTVRSVAGFVADLLRPPRS